MNWFQSLLSRFGVDYVVLCHFDGVHSIKRVRWIGGVPFAAPYLPETRGRLHPNGSWTGGSYIDGWLPATPRMAEYYAPAKES